MKVGLLTFHDTNNFGSYLQTYGLYKKVVDLGYTCEIIDYQCESIVEREDFGTYKFSFNPRQVLKDIFVNRVLRKKYTKLMRWLKENSKLSRRYYKETISDSCSCYDKLLVGSDIVWGMDITNNDAAYFLNFEKESSKKIAFASSVGNPWSKEEKKIIQPLLAEFNSVAVREEESADWVEELIGNRPDVVCDPTMLLTKEEWYKHTSNKYDNKKYILVYFPTTKNLEDAQKYAKVHGCKCFVVNYGLHISGFTSVKPTSIEEFLSLFRFASFVFTASYHGMLFSIYFNRDFAYYNRAHKSRMNTLARKLGVEDREGTDYDTMQMAPINYLKVNVAVEEYRNYSIQILKNMLEK